jgi:hypothetical protein
MKEHDGFDGNQGHGDDQNDQRDLDRWQGEGGALAGHTMALVLAPAPTSVRSRMARVLRLSRKIGVAVLGGAVLIVGVALIFLPGPAVVVIPLGLALLGTEFPWAQRLQRYVKERAASALGLAKRLVPGR